MPTTYYEWDEIDDNIVAEYDENGNTLVEYTHEPGLHGRLISEHRGGVSRQYHFDGQGNTIALTDDNQQITDTFAYTAFGEVTERTGTAETQFQYCGAFGYGYNSPSNDHYVRARNLAPKRGRWLSADPRAYVDGINRYRYVLNNPVKNVDPSGEFTLSCVIDQASKCCARPGVLTGITQYCLVFCLAEKVVVEGMGGFFDMDRCMGSCLLVHGSIDPILGPYFRSCIVARVYQNC